MSTDHILSRCRRVGALLGVALLLVLASLAVAAGPAPGATQHPYNLGCKALAAGDIPEATDLFTQAVKLDPADTDALNNLAVCYIETGDYGKALPLLQKVLRLNRVYSGADLNIGAGYLFQGDADKAEPPTRQAQDTPPTKVGKSVKAAALYNLGLIAAQDGRYADAQGDLEKSAAIAPSVQTDLALACALCAQGDYDQGISSLESLAKSEQGEDMVKTIAANLSAAYYQRGMARLEKGDLDGATADFTASNETATNDYAKMGLALVDADNGDDAAAIAVLTDLKQSDAPQLAKAASVNLDRVRSVTESGGAGAGSSSWLKWLILFGGGVLFAVQFYVVMRAATVRRRHAALGGVRMALGIVVGLATAGVFAWAFFAPPDTPLWVLVALGVDLAVVALASWTPSAARRTPHSA